MKRTLKLVVTMIALLMLVVGMFPNVALAASSVGVSLETSKNEVTSTNAVLYSYILNPQKGKITDVGIEVVDANSQGVIKSFTEKCGSKYAYYTKVKMWYDLNKELKIQLTPGTKYNYTMFAVINGKKYTASSEFTTPTPTDPTSPVKNPKITSAYGWRTLDGEKNFHYGTDIIGGKDIMAVASGKVVSAGYDKTGGNFVAIKHEDGYVSCYFHLASASVAKGDTVTQGQKIGVMGDTGTGARGVHLHLEIRTRWQGSLYGDGSWRNDCVDATSYISGLG